MPLKNYLEKQQSNIRTVGLPEFLGGGQYKTSGPGSLILSERGYAGIPSNQKQGLERHHIFPVEMGGVSTKKNIKMIDIKNHKKLTDVQNKAWEEFKKGDIDLPEARLKVMTELQRQEDEKKGITTKLWPNIISSLKDIFK